MWAKTGPGTKTNWRRPAHLEVGRVAPLRGGQVGAGVGRGRRRLAGGGRSCAAAERTHARGERQVEALARGALRARLAEEVRVGARAGADGGLVRACLAATLGGMLASAAPGRPVATGRVACGRRAALTARRPRAARWAPDDRPAFLPLALRGEPVG